MDPLTLLDADQTLKPFLIAFVAAAIGTYPIYRLLLALKSRQTVSQYLEGHQTKQGTPTMGGLIVIVGFLAVQLVSMRECYFRKDHETFGVELAVTLLFVGFALIGFIDDFVVPRLFKGKRGLGWKQKIVMQFGVAGGFCFSLDGFHWTSWVGIFFILFFSNAFNFSDGLDALAGSLLIGLAGGLAFISLYCLEWGLAPYIFALLGAILPFLYMNRPKANLFMGDVGSLPIGAILGMIVFVIAFPRFMPLAHMPDAWSNTSNVANLMDGLTPIRQPELTRWALLIVSGMMIVELVPVPLQILSVKLRKKKLFSFTPIHHAFERKGWPEQKVVAVFSVCQMALGVTAISIVRQDFDSVTNNARFEQPAPLWFHTPGVYTGHPRPDPPPDEDNRARYRDLYPEGARIGE